MILLSLKHGLQKEGRYGEYDDAADYSSSDDRHELGLDNVNI